MSLGQVVIVTSGRDKGRPMVIVEVLGEYALLADGRRRKLAKPKKKKLIHISLTNTVFSLATCGRRLQDADIRKLLGIFVKGGSRHCQKTML